MKNVNNKRRNIWGILAIFSILIWGISILFLFKQFIMITAVCLETAAVIDTARSSLSGWTDVLGRDYISLLSLRNQILFDFLKTLPLYLLSFILVLFWDSDYVYKKMVILRKLKLKFKFNFKIVKNQPKKVSAVGQPCDICFK